MNNVTNEKDEIFISHNSADAAIAIMIRDFLVKVNVSSNKIFCSSIPGNDVNSEFVREVKHHLQKSAVIILILSNAFYKSPYCNNEVGIAWYLDDEVTVIPIGLPEILPSDMQGFFNSNYILRRLDSLSDVDKIYDQVQSIFSIEQEKYIVVSQEKNDLVNRYKQYIADRKVNNNAPTNIITTNASTFHRKPKLHFSISYSEPSEEKYSDFYNRKDLINVNNDGSIELLLKSFSVEDIRSEYQTFKRSDIPDEIQELITDHDINLYNDSLPDESEIVDYENKYLQYLTDKFNGVPIRFSIKNRGDAKATNVRAEVLFPKQIEVRYLDDIVKIEAPRKPIKSNKLHNKIYKLTEGKNVIRNTVKGIKQSTSYLLAPSAKVAPYEYHKRDYEIIDNSIEISSINSIVHTESRIFNDGYIIPRESGVFEIRVILMCSEYATPQEQILKLFVENKT